MGGSIVKVVSAVPTKHSCLKQVVGWEAQPVNIIWSVSLACIERVVNTTVGSIHNTYLLSNG